ncbi:MAG: hypothetical protein ACO1QR_13900 [Chthoniobacteraceae bacterium]
MLADPIDGLLAGITSGPVRLGVVIGAVLLGFAVCILPSWRAQEWVGALLIFTFFSIFYWASFGAWFAIGICALIGIFAFGHAFLMERWSKGSLFAAFTCAVVYSLPLNLERKDSSWSEYGLYSLAIYLGACFVYWVLPRILARLASL